MKLNPKKLSAFVASLVIGTSAVPAFNALEVLTAKAGSSGMVLEYLNRGISAVNTGSGMLISWRYLANDDDNATYKLYRDGTLIYTSEAGKSTCYLDTAGSAKSTYRVDTLSGTKITGSETCSLISDNAYFDVPLSPPGSNYSPNDMSVGDVDGDGQYELFLKWDPSDSKDNSQKGKTSNVYIDCLRMDGTRLWRIDLGKNIRAGAHYTQFFVGDFDLDGKAEMTCKTADGTVDGKGKVIGDSSKDYRNSNGYVLSGAEYYTLFDGATGAILDTVDYEPGRGTVKAWGDSYGGRVDRFWGTVAYLDGVHPCVVTGRGYYTRMTATAYKVENKKLVKMWNFDTGNNSSTAGYGDGNHNSMPADVDGDGKQEIITGAAVIDDNGTLYYTTKQGHGDAMHVGDLDPTNPGLESWICHEEKKSGYGVTLVDLDQKKILYHQNGAGDTGRCCADNVWAGNPGAELWGNKLSDNSMPVIDTKGNVLSCRRPAINFLSYWDSDLEREILDGYTDSPATISKMNEKGTLSTILTTDGYYTCNTTKGTPCLSADIFGDWREELIVRASDSKSVRIYCTPYATDYRITTLMHDAQYRMQVSAQQTAYNQPPHPSFFLGTGYDLPKRPTGCTVNGATVTPVPVGKTGSVIDTSHKYMIKNVNSGLYLELADTAKNGTNVQQGSTGVNGWTLESAENGYYRIYSEAEDGKTYLLDLDYGKTDNGTNIGIWGDTASDAQLFKFVDNGDGTYTICTKATLDESCIGIASSSKDSGANALQWECSASNDQKWTLEIKVDPINGNLFRDLTVKDTSAYKNWKLDYISNGGLVFGDRDFTYTSLPDEINGCESILTACDSKNFTNDVAVFTAGADMTAYVLIDNRVTNIPSWLSDWNNTSLTAVSSNDVTFNIYSKEIRSGESVTLGANGQSAYCVNYTVFGKRLSESGKLVKNLSVKDVSNNSDWSILSTVSVGDLVFGDRTATYTSLPESVKGSEYLKTACDSKNSTENLAEFNTAENVTVYVAVDNRVATLPEWLSSYSATGETATSSNDVTFNIYKKSYSQGETVVLGTNGQSASCVNYTVFVKADEESVPVTTQVTTQEVPATTTVATTQPVQELLYGDANCDCKVTLADCVAVLQYVANKEKYPIDEQGFTNADVFNRGDGVTAMDALSIQKYDSGAIAVLPEN